eukprot:7357633-Prymnesium_polylepis.2
MRTGRVLHTHEVALVRWRRRVGRRSWFGGRWRRVGECSSQHREQLQRWWRWRWRAMWRVTSRPNRSGQGRGSGRRWRQRGRSRGGQWWLHAWAVQGWMPVGSTGTRPTVQLHPEHHLVGKDDAAPLRGRMHLSQRHELERCTVRLELGHSRAHPDGP